jgi:ABC-type phosphate/phosphonate transport system substrate-binding protein
MREVIEMDQCKSSVSDPNVKVLAASAGESGLRRGKVVRVFRRLPGLMAGLLTAAVLAAAQPAGAKPDELVMGINAGVSAGERLEEQRARFRRLGMVFSQALRQPVRIEPLYSSLVQTQLSRESYPVFIVHTHHALQAASGGAYRVVALMQSAKDDRIAFFTDGKLPVKTLADLKGRNVTMPAEFSFLSTAARAVLRQQKVDVTSLQTKYLRSQEAVLWVVENGLGEAGVTRSSAFTEKWRGKGGKVVFESDPVPVFAVLASIKMAPGALEALRSALVGMGESDTGRAALADIGAKGFAAVDAARLKNLAEWFGPR